MSGFIKFSIYSSVLFIMMVLLLLAFNNNVEEAKVAFVIIYLTGTLRYNASEDVNYGSECFIWFLLKPRKYFTE